MHPVRASELKLVNQMLTRREMIELVVRAAAMPGAEIFFSARLRADHEGHTQQRTAPPELDRFVNYQPRFFSLEDFAALRAFTEILIPEDDAPGAREAHCSEFIDFVLQSSNETPAVQARWRSAMEALKSTGFYSADPKRRVELITEMSRPESEPQAQHPAFAAYRLIKQLNTFAFYTSRVGTIDVLDYKGNSYNVVFPGCTHADHKAI